MDERRGKEQQEIKNKTKKTNERNKTRKKTKK